MRSAPGHRTLSSYRPSLPPSLFTLVVEDCLASHDCCGSDDDTAGVVHLEGGREGGRDG